MTDYPNFIDFAMANENLPFRFWVYRRMYTPLEQDKKYMDESYYEDTYCKIAYIREVIILPDNDILLGFEDAEFAGDTDEEGRSDTAIWYYKLSEIRLERYDGDVVDE